MKKHLFHILIFILLAQNLSLGQQAIIDSLETKLAVSEGKEKVNLFNRLSDFYFYNDTKTAQEYARKGIALAESLDYKKGLAEGYGSLGFSYIGSDYSKAIEYTNKALEIRKQINFTEGISKSLNVLGVINYYLGNYLLSIEYHLKSIEIKETIGNKPLLATSYNNIALVYMGIEDYDKALEYLDRALEIHEESANLRSTGLIKTNMGEIYAKTGQYEKARKQFNEAVQINKASGSKMAVANSYNGIANLLVTLKEYQKAREYYNSGLVLFTEMNNKNGMANSENGIANLLKIEENYNSSIIHAERALENAKAVNAPENIFKATNSLYYCYQKKGDFKKAFEYLLINKSVQDSLKNTEKLKKITKLELDLKFEKMRLEKENELNRQKAFNVYLVIILISGAVILLLIVRSSRNKKLVNIKLNELNAELNNVNSAKDRFFSIIAHDLKSPFMGFIGLTEIMAEDINSFSKTELSEMIKGVHNNAKNLFKLLSNLLEWAQIQQGKESFNPRAIPLADVILQNINLLIKKGEQKGIEIKLDVPSNQIVFADDSMLNSIIRNLLSNSLKFTSRGGKVNIKSKQIESNMIEVSVSDTGIGMSSDLCSKLFKPEEKVGRKGTEGEDSTGLGLLLCKEFVDKHSGKIWVDSEEGKGSTFYFTIQKG